MLGGVKVVSTVVGESGTAWDSDGESGILLGKTRVYLAGRGRSPHEFTTETRLDATRVA